MTYDYLTTAKEAAALARDLKRCKLGAVDTETTGLKPCDGDKNILLQISDGKRIYIIDRRTAGIEHFKPWLESTDYEKIIHNSFFDCFWLAWEFGIRVHNIYDTMYGERVMLGVVLPNKPDPRIGLTMARLKELKPIYSSALTHCLERRGLPAKLEFEPFFWFDQFYRLERKRILKKPRADSPTRLRIPISVYPEYKSKYKVIETIDSKQLYQIKDTQLFYSARDVENLHVLREDQIYNCEQLNLSTTLEIENRLCEVSYEMSLNGFGVDTQGWLNYTAENEGVFDAHLDKLKSFADINWNAPAQVCKYFGIKKIAELEQFEEATSYFKLAK
jgi:hypothetical protein